MIRLELTKLMQAAVLEHEPSPARLLGPAALRLTPSDAAHELEQCDGAQALRAKYSLLSLLYLTLSSLVLSSS
jgi:hypothetical protein